MCFRRDLGAEVEDRGLPGAGRPLRLSQTALADNRQHPERRARRLSART
jgi:hypothetical protein